MSTLTYPSPSLPGPVSVSLEIPDGWQAEAAPDVAFVAASPEETDGVHVNAVVSVRRIGAEIGVEQLAGLFAAEFQELDGCQVGDAELTRIGDHDAVVRTITLSDPTGAEPGSVHQLTAMCVAQVTEQVADAVTVTVTYPDGADQEQLDGYRRLVESLRVG